MNLRRFAYLGVLLLLSAGPVSASHFTFVCPEDRYLSVPLGQAHQFSSPIQAVAPGNDRVEVTFRPHLPDGWFAQWSLRSTGQTFIADAQIDLVVGLQDRLDIDITTESMLPAYGWIDVTIRATEDPLEVARCTYTLYAGMQVLSNDWDIDCTMNTLYLESPRYFEFRNPLVNHLPIPDTLLVNMEVNLPYQWDMHFHHDGVCFFPSAELPMRPYSAPDSLVVMGITGDLPGVGAGTLVLQSKRNPSWTRYCHFRVIYNMPGEAPQAAVPAGLAEVRVVPNPSGGETGFFFSQPGQQSGTLELFAADGRVVRSFSRIELNDGRGAVRWDGLDQDNRTVAPGIYFYRFGSGPTAHRGTIVRTR